MSADLMEKRVSMGKAIGIIAAALVVLTLLGTITLNFIIKSQYDKTPKSQLDLKAAQDQVDKEPKSVSAHIALGTEYTKIGQPQKALEEYKTAYDLSEKGKKSKSAKITTKQKEEDSYNAKSNLGYGYIGVEKYKEAIKILEPFVKEYDMHAPAHYNLAYAYYQDKQYEKSAEMFEESIKLDAAAADAYLYCGLSYEKLGKKDEALKNINEALKLVPTYKEALTAKERLSK